MTLAERTIAELVAEKPLRANVFERRRIDYCCGGGRTLEEVCRERGLSLEELVDELEQTAPAGDDRDWRREPLTALSEHIVNRHHSYLRKTLPSIAQKLEKVVRVHGAKHQFLSELDRVFAALEAELTQHMAKEEIVLFPYIGALEQAASQGAAPPPAPGGTVRNPIRMMEHEHDSAARGLHAMRALTGDYCPPDDACNTFRALYAQLEELEADLHQHIHLENNILFPRAAELEGELTRRG